MDVSNHALERYALRVMDKEDKLSINTYISLHKEDIESSINKMIEYGELIYTGVSVSEYNKNVVNVYLKDTWVIIANKACDKVITLYSIDLGVGRDFNEQYLELLLGRLHNAQQKYEEQKAEIVKQQEEFERVISENKAIIDEYRKVVKSLEEQNEMYDSLIASLHTNQEIAEKDVKDTVAILVGRKVF